MENVDKFLTLYNKLDEYLRRNVEQASDRTRPFSERLKRVKNSALRWNVEKLQDYGDLRNAIIHQRDPKGRIMAVPTDEALREFEQLVRAILSPPKLIPRFQKSIRTFLPHEQLVVALEDMRKNDYSQVVVRGEEKLFLLTVEGIAKWLEEQAKKDKIAVQEAIIAEALKHEPQNNVAFMRRDQTVYEAIELFQQAIEQEKPHIYALLITANGKATESPLGIVTPSNLVRDHTA